MDTAAVLPSDGAFVRAVKSIVRDKRTYLALCFIVPSSIMALMYFCMGVYPVDNGSVLVLDLNGQYVYFFEGLRALLHGDGSILYSFSRAMGGEFFGIYAYYLASPLSWIVALFPKENITEALFVMFLIKCGWCGLDFGIYVHCTRKRRPAAAVMFSTMYALTAYAVVMGHNTMWIDCVALLPLVTLGLERLIKQGRFKLYVISLAVAVWSCFYIGYMMCIYVALYFFYYFIAHPSDFTNELGERSHVVKSLRRAALFSLVALCICAVVLMTAYYSLTFGKTTFSDPSYDFTQRFDFADLLSKFYFGSYDTVRPEGLPFVYCGMLTLILVPLYFIAPHILPREKIASALLISIFVISFNGSTIDLFWHGMQRPNWLNYRYSFMLCFILLICAFKAYERLREVNYRTVVGIIAAIAGFLIILQKLELTNDNLPDIIAVWVSLFICGVYLVILRYAIKDSAKEAFEKVLLLAVCAEMFAAGLVNLNALGDDVVFSSRTSYRSFIDRVEPVTELIKEGDDSFYRMEKTLHRKTNDNFALGIRGLSNSTSTLNAEIIKFLNELGLSSKSHWSKYLGGTPVADSLLGIKYLITEKDDEVSKLYNKLFTYNDDLSAYENSYALPIAYACDENILNLIMDEYTLPFVRMNEAVADMLGRDSAELFLPITIDNIGYENCLTSYTTGHKKYTPASSGKPCKILFTFTAVKDGTIWCYFPSDYQRQVSLTLNGASFGDYYANESYRILTLGYHEAGETITLTMTLDNDKNELYIGNESTYFYYLDEDLFRECIKELAEGGYNIESFTEDSFSGTINVPEGKEMIFTSIPYDEGWNITLDGQVAEPVKALGACLAFYAPAGEHTLSLVYRPSVYTFGLMITVTGLVVFIIICAADYIERRRVRAARTGDADTSYIADAELITDDEAQPREQDDTKPKEQQ